MNIENILITKEEPGFREKVKNLQEKLSVAGTLKNSRDKADAVRRIVDDVADRGDEALADYTLKFDNAELKPEDFRVSGEELKAAHESMDFELLSTMRKSVSNVKRYQSEIFVGKKNEHPGIKYTPLKRVGICVPGAAAPLPSTVIMTAVPAMVAGVEDIVVVSPPRYQGSIHPVILGLCEELGIKEVYRIGGAQAVAAMAWGTETIEKVDKIAGPGNLWGQLAKKEVFGVVDIDSVAGPSEVLIIADSSANPEWLAADMLSQAEHGLDSSAIVVTDSIDLAEQVLKEVYVQVGELSRSDEALKSLHNYSGIIVTDDLDEAVVLANEFAAEHLQIQCGQNSRKVADKIRNAGAIFVGAFTPVATGDYWAGPSHTLPTGASAKYFSALSANDFVKTSSIIEYSDRELKDSAADIIRLAETEGLTAHAESVRKRVSSTPS